MLAVMFFGWVILVIRHAFAKRIDRCADCGAEDRYKTPGSWICLGLVLVFGTLLAALIVIDQLAS